MNIEELKRVVEPVCMEQINVEIEKEDNRKIVKFKKRNTGFQEMLDTEIEKLQS